MSFCILIFGFWIYGFAQDNPSSSELITKAWAAHAKFDIEATYKYTQQCIDLYKDQADKEQSSLRALPKTKEEIGSVQVLNDVACAYFIQAESLMRQGKNDEAIKLFKLVIDKYPFAQGWDQRGWFWVIAKAALESIDKLNGKQPPVAPIPQKQPVSQLATKIVLYDPGKSDFLDYGLFGEFKNAGTKDYQYIVGDQEGLSQAVGEGIYPNSTSIRWDPEFKKALKAGRLNGDHWDFVHSPDLQAAFFKWGTCSEPQGVKLFYTALLLERSGLIKHAIKCYYAIVVHFPGSYGWTYWHTPWYVGQAAIAKINFLLKRNPAIGYRLVDADIRIINGFDNDLSNDVVIANPGRFVKHNWLENLNIIKNIVKVKPDTSKLIRCLGKGRVYLRQYASGDWELIVDDKPYIIKGITYAPTKVGQSPDEGTLGNWMEEDYNSNGRIDGPYDAFVDKNRNNKQDKFEPAVGDFKLMLQMGVNTIRLYHHPNKVNKELLGDLYKNYGIMVIMGDFLGKYTFGSGAAWNPGTDYTNPEHKKNMLESVRSMVEEFKDEPYILFWLLGNENVYGYACNADKHPEAFFEFVNEAAKLIKSLDQEHPVAIASGDILFLDKFAKLAWQVDIFGTNAYRGDYGFGAFWEQVKELAARPALITEFGCSAYAQGKTLEEGEVLQAEYHRGLWEDIQGNMAFGQGAGNSIGGIVFEWLDEWWKGYEPSKHDTKGFWTGPFPDGLMHEEWLGLCGQGDGKLSPFLRQPRKSYYMYKKMWR